MASLSRLAKSNQNRSKASKPLVEALENRAYFSAGLLTAAITSAPTAVIQREPVPLSVTLTNTSGATISNEVTIEIVAVQTVTGGSSPVVTNIPIGSVTEASGAIKANKSKVFKVTVPALPKLTPTSGTTTYTFEAIVTGKAENFLTSTSAVTGAVAINPRTTVVSPTISKVSATTAKATTALTITVDVTNNGNTAITGPLEIDLGWAFGATGTTPDAQDPLKAVTFSNVSIAAGKTQKFRITETAGNYLHEGAGNYFAVAVVDANGLFGNAVAVGTATGVAFS